MAKQSMSEIIAEYNTLAVSLGKDEVDGFKNLSAARAALEALQLDQYPDQVDPNREVIPAGDDSEKSGPKYNTAGKRGPTQGVGAFCKGLIADGKTNDEILAAVAEQFPTAKTTRNCVAYYRAKLKAKLKAPAAVAEEATAEEEVAA